ncbi:unnamed protein product [Rotaria socialis]|uniref:non-specific serine/threonine protein kinase n=1 Tax=Rotaria socialis TaxID=392032 RepID=A0A820V4U3_9BILA|nr:unnamed protein product [Rotaria socialis]CAF4495531.1 unnamed protein product [Rotaria socialis]
MAYNSKNTKKKKVKSKASKGYDSEEDDIDQVPEMQRQQQLSSQEMMAPAQEESSESFSEQKKQVLKSKASKRNPAFQFHSEPMRSYDEEEDRSTRIGKNPMRSPKFYSEPKRSYDEEEDRSTRIENFPIRTTKRLDPAEVKPTFQQQQNNAPPLPPITTTQNFNEIFQEKLQNDSMKDFKDYFLEHAKLTGKIECDGSLLLTDAHLYELGQFDWPYLDTIRIRACPNLTPLVMDYIEGITRKYPARKINVNVELMLHAHNTIENKSDLFDSTMIKLEPFFGKSTKKSITKVLIYHTNASINSMLSSEQMIINHVKPSKESSPKLLNYLSSKHDECQVSVLECANSILFKELFTAFHPKIIYMVISTVHDVLKCIFSLDSIRAFTFLKKKQIRFIINNNAESDEQFFSHMHLQLDNMCKSAHELYSQFIDEKVEYTSENDDFRRNHFLTSLLHVQTKCTILKDKLTKDQTFIFRENDLPSIKDHFIKDSIKYSQNLHVFNTIDNFIENEENNKVFETKEPIAKLVNHLDLKAKDQHLNSATQNSTNLAQSYYVQKLVIDQVLDIYSVASGKSYFISDIEWFCDIINNLCNMETHINRKTEHIIRQFRQTLGTNIRILSRRDFNKLKANGNDMNFFQWLFNKWNIAYSVSVVDQTDDNMFVLFNSMSSESPIPLNNVWSPSWPKSELEMDIYFHLLHPCNESILLHLYKSFPSQKLLLASKYFLLIQEGAIEILLQYHYQTNHNAGISVTFRTVNLSQSSNETDPRVALVQESLQYVVREYYVIIWAFLFKHDYAFKVEDKSKSSSNNFEAINGNEFMYHQWQHLALYHYLPSPTHNSACSVCGLRPSANKSLYDACTILSPGRRTTEKKSNTQEVDNNRDQSGLLILRLGDTPLSFTGKYSVRPDGCNTFEVIFLSTDKEDTDQKIPILSSIQIGCLMNNAEIKDDEKILFEYGTERPPQEKTQDIQRSQEINTGAFLDEIRKFGGIQGLKGAKNKAHKKKELQELYTGLRLRIDILFTDKPNFFEFVFSINDVPWARQTVKRKSTQTIFQPIVQSPGIHNSQRNINLIIRHHKSELDIPMIPPATSNTKKTPWKVGMRMEAKDRKNPYILAAANIIEVYDDNRIRINFDGWTSSFDYTVETDNTDLHPCGYWEYVQRVLYKNPNPAKANPHFTFTRYDKPKSYDGIFSWRNYLTEKNQEPVPLECFSYVQTEGMTADYFPHGVTKAAFTSLSCRHYHNVRVRYHKMNTIIQDEIVNRILYEHHMEFSSPTTTTNPGAVLLPTPFDLAAFTYPCLKQFQNSSDVVVHLTCNHRSISPLDSTTIISGAHLMDTEGGQLPKSDLNSALITICMLTAMDLVRNQKRLIAPSTSKLISNNDKSFDIYLIDYYMRRWLDLSAYITCFNSTSFFNRRPSTLNQVQSHNNVLYTCYNDPDIYTSLNTGLNSIEIKSTNLTNTKRENQFGKYGECYYCCLLRKDEIKERMDVSLQKRFELVGNYSPSIFYLEFYKQDKNILETGLILNDEFFLKFNGLEIIDIKNIIIDRFQLNNKNRYCLKYLTYLSLENNNLATMQLDFQYLNNLTYLKLVDNPLETLPLNCLSPQSLQSVDLSRLGRLNEIDPNTQFSSKLKSLLITESVLTTLPQTLVADARAKLTKLTLNGATWWSFAGISVNEVVKKDSFIKKFVAFLDDDELDNIYRMYDEDVNGVLTYSEINLMNAHMYRYIQRLRPSNTKIPTSGRSSVEPSNTTNELDIFKQESFMTDISGIPSAIFHLDNLTELSLEYQGIKVVPDAIKNLKYLVIFNLNYCIELESLSAEVGFLPLRELNLTGCASLKTPPIEITRRGHAQTMAFLQRLISGSTPCKRTKLMLVGLGGAGKTSLVRAFLESHSDKPPEVTDGIDIVKWKVPLSLPDDFLEFSVWDFAGQSVYYHTHQFFLAKKAVYILAWNIRLGAEHAGLDFWLSSICCHAPNAPIFVVGTHSDLVSRIDLRQDDYKRRYPQITGFFNVSTFTGDNVSELIDSIIKTTLELPYMDELIPKVWLSFETLIPGCNEDILQYNQVADIAHNAGIFDAGEVLQAVQFLHDLGSLQYFSSEHLKNYVVINPQWIINVMACIVSIRDSPVKNGRLFHSDISTIWIDYDSHLHPWILKLTEAFDLTFPVPDQNMNLVPCLLPEEEPEYAWEDVSSETELREMKVVYTFNYLPAGLFNRAQVRLFQFSDKSTIWRYGSLLIKNNHRAVIIRSDDRHIVIKIQGVRPDNVLFLIHEVFEGLVNESFFGVTYDIAFPCPDCLDARINEPWQFSSSLINRAIELKAPSIQCHRFFHVASVTDLQALIPPDSKSNYDLHLEYSVRDLKSYKQNMAVDIAYLYPPQHIPTKSEIEIKVDPRKIKDDLTKQGLAVWTPESMKDFVIENHYLVIKEARFILFGISNELVYNPENKKLYDAFQVITNILRKTIIPVLFGNDMKWKESDLGVALSDKLYINMQNPKRYDYRIKEIIDMTEQENGQSIKSNQLRDQSTDIFISYCWMNSHDAVSKGTKPTGTSIGWGDPRALKDYLEERGLQVWMDVTRLGKSGVLHDIVHGLKNTKVVIACVSDEYTLSEVCRNEFLFAKNTLRLPVVLGIFGMGDKWRTTEVGMCSLTCSQVNFQFENPSAFEDIYDIIQSNLPKRPTSAKGIALNAIKTTAAEEKTTAAYQELFELTQRKFLRVTSGFADTMNARDYPRLFTLDFVSENEKSAQELARIELATQMNAQRQQENDEDRDLEAERQRDEQLAREQNEIGDADGNSKEKEAPKTKIKKLCIRTLCENEENWHTAGSPFEITEQIVIQNSALYLSRIMLLLKQSDLPLEILTSKEGEIELQKINEISNSTTVGVKDSYVYLRRCIMDCDSEERHSGLKQCLMPSGKVLWLCEQHQKQPRVVLVTGSLGGSYNHPQVEEKSEIVKALVKLNERIANNELPPPTLKVSNIESARLPSVDRRSHNSRHRSQRLSQHDFSMVKSQRQSILLKDKTIDENDDENYQTNLNELENENSNETQANTIAESTDCTIM